MTSLFRTPVREHMSQTLVAVRPTTKLDAVQSLFEEHDISAVPIIDDDGTLRGIVSTTDLLRVARIALTTPGDLAQITAPPHDVADVMRTDVVTVDEGAPVREAAEKMFRHRIHRVVVLRHGKAVGVLSTRDAMRAVLFHHIETPLGRVMSEPVVTIGLADTIKSAVGRLGAANVRGLVSFASRARRSRCAHGASSRSSSASCAVSSRGSTSCAS